MIWLLIAAAIISGILGDWIDCGAILAIVVLNVTISLFQEEKPARPGGPAKTFAADCQSRSQRFAVVVASPGNLCRGMSSS